MAEEKKRRGRRAHLNDFYRDVSGNYIYTGTCYVCTASPQERTALLRRLWLLAAVMAVSVVSRRLHSPRRAWAGASTCCCPTWRRWD